MKLSEAIRLGAMLKPQGAGLLVDWRGTQTCALGAALDALGQLSEGGDCGDGVNRVKSMWPWLSNSPVPCPVCPEWHTRRHYADDIFDIITNLNDAHDWTREQIADWVETIEAQQALVPIPEDAQQVKA